MGARRQVEPRYKLVLFGAVRRQVIMNILILSSELPYPPYTGGARLKLYHLVRLLAQRHRVTLLCSVEPDQVDAGGEDVFRQWGVEVYSYPANDDTPPGLDGWPPFWRRFWGRPLVEKLDQLLETHESDVAHLDIPPAARFVPYLQERTSLPVVVAANDSATLQVIRAIGQARLFSRNWLRMLRNLWYARRRERTWYKPADAVVMVGDKDKVSYERWSGARNGHVIPLGVDTEAFRPAEHENTMQGKPRNARKGMKEGPSNRAAGCTEGSEENEARSTTQNGRAAAELQSSRTEERQTNVPEPQSGRDYGPTDQQTKTPTNQDTNLQPSTSPLEPSTPSPLPPFILFTGTMNFGPNIDAACWFAREVLPLVRKRKPDVTFAVVGRDPRPEVLALNELDGVEVVGAVPEMLPWLQKCTVFASPIRTGSGIKTKVLEAMAAGCAVVALPNGVAGIECEPEKHFLAGKDAQELAQQIIRALEDADLRNRLGTEARELVKEHYSWESMVEQYEALYTGVVTAR